MENYQNITYIDLKLDYAFHLVFGAPGNEDLLLKLINAILPEKHFTSVRLSNSEQVGLRRDSRKAVFDIFATTSDGSDVTIEMQYSSQDDFNQRMVFYSSFPVQNNIPKGRDKVSGKTSYSFPPVYVIAITNFVMPNVKENPNLINQYVISNKTDITQLLTDKVTYVTVELPKFTKVLKDLNTPADYLLYAVKNIGEMDAMPNEYKGSGLEKMFELCRFATMTLAEQRQYLAEYMAELDEHSRIVSAINEGKRIGETEGRMKGLAEGRAEVAKAMLAKGLAGQMISECTGLTAEDLAALQ